jgi:hypothetical protein
MTTDTIDQAAQAAVSGTELVLREAETLAITTNEEYQGAAQTLREIKTRWKDIEDERKRILLPFDEARKRIMDLFRPAQDNLAQAEALLKRGILAWTLEQQRLQRVAEAAAAEIARKEAERLQKQADKALAAGHIEKAAALEGAADAVVPAEIAPPPKAYGTSTREVWRAEVVDKDALIKAVAAGEADAEVLEVNMAYLNQAARLRKNSLHWPGVNVIKEEIVVAQTGIRSQDALPRGARE